LDVEPVGDVRRVRVIDRGDVAWFDEAAARSAGGEGEEQRGAAEECVVAHGGVVRIEGTRRKTARL
jgi:hypothetical protein